MNWLLNHPWIQSRVVDPAAIVVHVGPERMLLLPRSEVPDDLVERLQAGFEDGTSASALALQLGLPVEMAFLLAAIGRRAGLWRTWPEPNNPLWTNNPGNLPTLHTLPPSPTSRPLVERWEEESQWFDRMDQEPRD